MGNWDPHSHDQAFDNVELSAKLVVMAPSVYPMVSIASLGVHAWPRGFR